jgi:hypothetical protein
VSKVTIYACTLIAAFAVGAQAQQHVWSMLLDNPSGHDGARLVAADASGNIVVGGEFSEELIFSSAVLDSHGSRDVYLVKLTSQREFLWAAQIGGPGPEEATGMGVDAAGNVYVMGTFYGTADFGGAQLTTAGLADVFVAAYASNDGSLLWARRFGDAATDIGSDLFVSGGDLIVAANFQQTISFGGETLVSAGSYDVALARLSTQDGSHRWSARFGREAGDQVSGVAVGAQNRLYACGYFDLQTDAGSGVLVSSGNTDSYVAAFDAGDGRPLWSRKIGGTGFDVSRDVTATPDGNVVVIGYFGLAGGPVDFGGGAIASAGGADAFLASYRGSDGGYLWTRTVGDLADDHLRSIAVDPSGNLAVSGYFQIQTNLGGEVLASQGQLDVLVAQYSPSGAHLWSRSFGGILGDQAFGIALDPSNHIIVVGHVSHDVDFGGGLLIPAPFTAPFILELTSAAPAPPTQTPQPPVHTPTRTRTPTPTRTPTATATQGSGAFGVAGRVTYFRDERPVPGVGVALRGSSNLVGQTNSLGAYSFAGLTQGGWTIEPAKSGDVGDAVSSLDAAFVLQAVTGLRQFDPDQRLACDVTGNGELSSLDAARILQFLLGTEGNLPVAAACQSDWVFVPNPVAAANQLLTQPNVANGGCQRGAIGFNPLAAPVQEQNFRAILFGDCTGNWATTLPGSALRATGAGAQIFAGRLRQAAGGKASLPIFVRSTGGFHAAQLSLRYDADGLVLTGVRSARRDDRVLVRHAEKRPGSATIVLASAGRLRSGRIVNLEFATRSPLRSSAAAVVAGTVDENPAHVGRGRTRR